jgi:hypothetical protein
MKPPEDAEIRSYLLGQLDPESELNEAIDKLLYTDPKFPLRVDTVEDEIVEQYLEGDLNPIDRLAVERHFLRPPQRQEHLRTARLIQRHLSPRGRILRLPQLPAWSAIAAAALLGTCMFSLWRQHRRINSLESANRQLEDRNRGQLARSERPSTALASAVQLNLLEPGLSRSADRIPNADQIPNLDLAASVDIVHVAVALQALSPGPYRITLLHNDAATWTGPSLRASPVGRGGILRFDISAAAIPGGTCKFELKSASGDDIVYWFTVRRL